MKSKYNLKINTIAYVIFILAFFHFSSYSSEAGWVVHYYKRTSWHTSITYYADSDFKKESNYNSLKDALDEIHSNGKIKLLEYIGMSWLLRERLIFQDEIFTELRRIAPVKLKAAFKSAGNMHNPKMKALRESFSEAVLATATVKRIDKTLNSYGFKINGVSHEKLTLNNINGEKQFDAILTLEIGKKP